MFNSEFNCKNKRTSITHKTTYLNQRDGFEPELSDLIMITNSYKIN